jgi:hypothetical protein
VVRLSPALPTALMPGKAFHSASPPALSPVWSRLARQPVRALRDASFAIPLPISQTLFPAVSTFPCALPVDSAPVHASGVASCHRSQPSGWAALLPGGSMARRAVTNALQNGIRLEDKTTRHITHCIFLSFVYI